GRRLAAAGVRRLHAAVPADDQDPRGRPAPRLGALPRAVPDGRGDAGGGRLREPGRHPRAAFLATALAAGAAIACERPGVPGAATPRGPLAVVPPRAVSRHVRAGDRRPDPR